MVKLHSRSASDSPESETTEQGIRSPNPGRFWVSQIRGSVSLGFFLHLVNGDDNICSLFLWTSKVTTGESDRAGLPPVGSWTPESLGNSRDHVCLL